MVSSNDLNMTCFDFVFTVCSSSYVIFRVQHDMTFRLYAACKISSSPNRNKEENDAVATLIIDSDIISRRCPPSPAASPAVDLANAESANGHAKLFIDARKRDMGLGVLTPSY